MGDSSPHRARWTGDGSNLAGEVLDRLSSRRPLADLGLGDYEGRVDLRGMALPEPTVEPSGVWRGWLTEEVTGVTRLNDLRLEGVDLSDSSLDSAVFTDTQISNCRFDGASCRKVAFVRTRVVNTSFTDVDFRDARLGVWDGGGNTYEAVSFRNSDLRLGACSAASFIDCDFSGARIENVDFQSSSFVRCRFAGELRQVMFYDRGFRSQKPEPNRMEDVDFSAATLRDVEFRRLNLDRVQLPTGTDHLVIRHYRCVLERALAGLAGEDSLEARRLSATLRHRMKWAGPTQEMGVFNLLDYERSGGAALLDLLVERLRDAEHSCGSPG